MGGSIMASTYDLLYTETLSSSTSSITINNLNTFYSNGYKDLCITFVANVSSSISQDVRFNGDSQNNYDIVGFDSWGGVWAFSANRLYSPASYWNNDTSAEGSSVLELELFNFGDTSSNYKNALVKATGERHGINFCKWNQQGQAINSITFSCYSANSYLAGSKISIYGIAI